MEIRRLELNDYDKGYLLLLEQLTYVGTVTKDNFEQSFNKLNTLNTNIFVIECNDKIIASGTLFIEHKFIHNLACVGHIEDIIIDNNYRNKNLGKKLTEQHKRKIGDANKHIPNYKINSAYVDISTKRNEGSKNPNSKKIICNNIIFGCMKDAYEYFKVSKQTFKKRYQYDILL